MTTVPVGSSVGQPMTDGPVRARLGTWPHDPAVCQIVLLDHHMVPTPDAVRRWIRQAERTRPRSIRTGALFPPAADAFRSAGFREIDSLALLEADLGPRHAPLRRARVRTAPLRSHRLAEVAQLDRVAFGDPWGNDERSLRDVMTATPRTRARVVVDAGRIAGFAISGQSAGAGYLQRLAVHPDAQRNGIARELVADGLRWMRRRGATSALVNTALDNEAALALYAGFGFVRRAETLTILELAPR